MGAGEGSVGVVEGRGAAGGSVAAEVVSGVVVVVVSVGVEVGGGDTESEALNVGYLQKYLCSTMTSVICRHSNVRVLVVYLWCLLFSVQNTDALAYYA